MPKRILHVLELQQQLSDDQIHTIVHRFYERVQSEPLLAPVFASRIATAEWPAHLDKMVRFWSTILRGTNRYHGNPMQVHTELGGLTRAHFDRWLTLFAEVAGECVPKVVADSILQRAHRMGDRLLAAAER